MAKDTIQARLTIYGLPDMNTKQFNSFKKWIQTIDKEMQAADRKDYAKRFRATLFN